MVSGTFWCQASGVPEKVECRAPAGARCAPLHTQEVAQAALDAADLLTRGLPAQTEPDESPGNGHPAPFLLPAPPLHHGKDPAALIP